MDNQNIDLKQGIQNIIDYKAGSSLTPILDFIYQVYEASGKPIQSWEQPSLNSKNPDTFLSLILFLGSIIHKRKEVTVLYETCLEKYQTFTHMVANKKQLSDDENKLKETLTEYILDVEKLFETNDLTDEAIIKELNRFATEFNLNTLTDTEIRNMVVSAKALVLMEPHLEKYKTIHQGYSKIIPSLGRLIRISDLIIEELTKKQPH